MKENLAANYIQNYFKLSHFECLLPPPHLTVTLPGGWVVLVSPDSLLVQAISQGRLSPPRNGEGPLGFHTLCLKP